MSALHFLKRESAIAIAVDEDHHRACACQDAFNACVPPSCHHYVSARHLSCWCFLTLGTLRLFWALAMAHK
jgi:hypothetical protein